MAIALTAPATTGNDTIVVVMTDDNNLVGLASRDFTLFRADTNVELSSNISVSKRRSAFIWDITVTKSEVYLGAAYLQMAARSARELDTLALVPPRNLNSNRFEFAGPPSAPSNLVIRVIDANTVELSFTASTGTVTQYQYRFATSEAGLASAVWTDGGTDTTITVGRLQTDTLYYFQVRAVNTAGNSDASAAVRVTVQLPPVITQLQAQEILLATDFDIQIPISNNPNSVEMTGNLNKSGYHYDSATGMLHFRGNIDRIVSDQVATITARNAGGAAIPVELVYSTVNPAPIITITGPYLITRGRFFDLLIPVQNVTEANITGLLTYLDQETLVDEHAVRIFGTIPEDAEFTTMRGTWRITASHRLGPVVGTADFFIRDEDFVFTPDAPTGLMADGDIGGGAIRLSWAAVTGISSYEYRIGTGDWVDIGNMLSVDVGDLENGISYVFDVRAIDGHGVPSATSTVTAFAMSPPQ